MRLSLKRTTGAGAFASEFPLSTYLTLESVLSLAGKAGSGPMDQHVFRGQGDDAPYLFSRQYKL
jgi:hypothetical protein